MTCRELRVVGDGVGDLDWEVENRVISGAVDANRLVDGNLYKMVSVRQSLGTGWQ